MRSGLDGRIAGTGTTLAFVEIEDTYQDRKIRKSNVRMPSDFTEYASSDVKEYTLTEDELKKYH